MIITARGQEGVGGVSAVKIKKHVNLRSPLFARASFLSVNALLLLLLLFFSCFSPVMYKGGKNHIKPTDFLNFYMSERGSEGSGGVGGWESKGISKLGTKRRLREK